MRRQCLFDPNHLIDEYAFDKHLQDCKSKLKKDWRNCRYDSTHWYLYHQIQFHQNYECPLNPLNLKNPKQFQKRRQKQISNIKRDIERKKKSQIQPFLADLKPDSEEQELSFHAKPSQDQINFGQISVIEERFKINQSSSKLSQNDTIQNHSIFDLHHVLNNDAVFKPTKNSSVLNLSQNFQQILSKDQQMFEKGITETKKRWQEPDIIKFEANFRVTWQAKRQQKNAKKEIDEQEKVAKQFNEELDEIKMSFQDMSIEYNDIDYD